MLTPKVTLLCTCSNPTPAQWPHVQPVGGYYCARCHGYHKGWGR